MQEIEIKELCVSGIANEDLIELYKDTGWTAYTNDMSSLTSALNNSLSIHVALKENEVLGMIRIVGDGATIIYIQDIIVRSDHRRKGIGRRLVSRILEEFKNVRQTVLMTDDSSENRAFYSSMGFRSCDDGKLIAFIKAPV